MVFFAGFGSNGIRRMNDSGAAEGFRFWLRDLPHVGVRVLSVEERQALGVRLHGERRQRRLRLFALNAIDYAVAAIAIGFALWNPAEGSAGSAIAASVGLALVSLMALGSVYVALLARQATARWAMRSVLVAL